MKAETDPIDDDEWLLRRVRYERFRTDDVPVVSPNAFEPRIKGRDPDTNGISLYRAACLNDPSDTLATIPPERRHEYGIVRLSVAYVRSLGLSVVVDSDDKIKGHVVIPELNAADYEANKARFTKKKVMLATEASKDENVVRWPSQASG